jgi:hypothetical protein
MMSPAASPAGADATPELARCRRALELAPSLSFAEIVALAIVGDASHRLGAGVERFELGLARLFTALAAHDCLDRLDDHVALVGRDFACLAQIKVDHIRCADDGFIVVPLGPILAELRDRVFS